MSGRKILFIVEGKKTEPRFLKQIHNAILGTCKGNIISYGMNIHELISRMMPNGSPESNLDLIAVLREMNEGKEDDVLNQNYAFIYLIFDMDPQDQKYNPTSLSKALEYFNDPTENGKLYLNYPMMESYRHILSDDFEKFCKTKVRIEHGTSYKSIVNSQCMKELKDISKYSENIFMMILEFNLRKTLYLISGCDSTLNLDKIKELDLGKILSIQNNLYLSKSEVYILNTSVLNVIEFNPEEIVDRIKNRNNHSVDALI